MVGVVVFGGVGAVGRASICVIRSQKSFRLFSCSPN